MILPIKRRIQNLHISPGIAIPFAIAAVSTAAIFIRFAQTEAPSLTVAFYRMVISAVLLAPFAIITIIKDHLSVDRRDAGFLLLGGLLLAAHFALWISSLEYTTVTSSVVLVTTTPLWVALISPLVLREGLSGSSIVGMIIALLGSTIVGLSDVCTLGAQGISCPDLGYFFQGKAVLGDVLAILGAWMAAGYLMVGRRLRRTIPLLPYTFFVYGAASLFLLALVVLFQKPITGFSANTYLWLFALAFIPQIIGHSTFNWALKFVPASTVSVALLGEPIGSTILAMILLNEIPGGIKVFGAIFIITGIWLSSRNSA